MQELRPLGRVTVRAEEAARLRVGRLAGLFEAEHRLDATVVARQKSDPLVPGLRAEECGQLRLDGDLARAGGIALGSQVRAADGGAEHHPELGLEGGDRERSAVGTAPGAVTEQGPGELVLPRTVRRYPLELLGVQHDAEPGDAVGHGSVDEAATPGACALVQRRQDAHHGIERPAGHVGRLQPWQHNLVVGPGDAREAGDGEVVEVVPRLLGQR